MSRYCACKVYGIFVCVCACACAISIIMSLWKIQTILALSCTCLPQITHIFQAFKYEPSSKRTSTPTKIKIQHSESICGSSSRRVPFPEELTPRNDRGECYLFLKALSKARWMKILSKAAPKSQVLKNVKPCCPGTIGEAFAALTLKGLALPHRDPEGQV